MCGVSFNVVGNLVLAQYRGALSIIASKNIIKTSLVSQAGMQDVVC